MESHILNTFHQARYRIHGLNRSSTSESYSSESSCTQNSPEYPQKLRELGEGWKGKRSGSTNLTCKVEEDSSESSSDYDEVQEPVLIKHEPTDAYAPAQSTEPTNDGYYAEEMMVGDSDDDYEIVVDDEAPSPNGPIIQVYAVDPDLDLEGSEDEQDYAIQEEVAQDDEGDMYAVSEVESGEKNNRERHDSLGINLDTPVVTNVDEYFIKEKKDEEKVLDVKDQPVVQDVDEYFIKENDKISETLEEVPNVEEFFIKVPEVEKVPVRLELDEAVPNVGGLFNNAVEQPVQETEETNEVRPESAEDAEILPHIEHIKRFLLEDMPCPKLHTKSMQRSCSLPHSPAHFSYLDADEAKTSLSFEDLNIDLSDFTFDEGKAVKNIQLPIDEDANTSDDNPRTLTEEDVNSFLITSKPGSEKAAEEPTDDLSQEDMEIDAPVETKIDISETAIAKPIVNETPAPKAATVFDYCIEKPASEVKVKKIEPKLEVDDFVDVESLNDTVIPVLAATNVSALLEQFEATEKFNTNVKKKIPIKVEATAKAKVGNGLPSGVRLQDAAVQLNKNKMRHILMSTPTSNSSVKKTSQPVHSDHDYCSPKKRYSLPASLKGGQSLLKPEVLSSNSKILSSRHRSCKNKNVVYHQSSDDEDGNSARNKTNMKPSVKALLSNHRKKLSPVIPSVANVSCKEKGNVSVMSNNASKASDNCSQSSSGSIKLTIKNKSKVILKIDCDDKKDSQKLYCIKNNESVKHSVSKVLDIDTKPAKQESDAKLIVSNDKIENSNVKTEYRVVKEENLSLKEDFYTALFKNKQDIHIALPEPTIVKAEGKSIDNNENKSLNDVIVTTNVETKPLKKKLNLQEYKLRREGVHSNGSSRTVSPEAIFPDIQIPLNFEKTTHAVKTSTPPSDVTAPSVKPEVEEPKLFDPIRDASRKILANTKKQKAEATRKRDEDIVMSKIPKVENLQLQPLISDAEMRKIVGMGAAETAPLVEKPKSNTDYVEIVLVSVGTNTDQAIFKRLIKLEQKRKSQSPTDDKSINEKLINFRIKKSENVLKVNVFDPVKNDAKSPNENRNVSPNKEAKIDKERYKDITATLKSVGKHVDKKICSNSLFASIQDVVMKKAPDQEEKNLERDSTRKSSSPVDKKSFFKPNSVKTPIVREYDSKTEHGEDKIILHLEKNRTKPSVSNMVIQTDHSDEFDALPTASAPKGGIVRPTKCIRKRTVSDMSLSSEDTPTRQKDLDKKIEKRKSEDRTVKRSRSRNRSRSRSKSRYRSKYSKRNRRRTSSRSRSRSVDRYRSYRRSHSPYRRSQYRSSRSRRRGYRHRSRSRNYRSRTRSPMLKKGKLTPESDKKELTPRKPTVSESSDTSTSSTSSSSSGSRVSRSRSRSLKSRRSASLKRSTSPIGRRAYSSYSEEARDCSTPVEERRIVFVGKLEKEANKSSLRALFGKFGPILEVTLHSKEDGCRYGFVTFQRARDAWSTVEAASTFPNYDVGFGGRRAFCRQRYADLDGLEAEYSEGYLGPPPAPAHQDMSFEQMLLDMKHKLSQRKTEKREEKP